MKTLPIAVLVLACMGFLNRADAEIYKWTDDQGNVVFGNSPPPGSKNTEVDKQAPASPQTSKLPIRGKWYTHRDNGAFIYRLDDRNQLNVFACGDTCDHSNLVSRGTWMRDGQGITFNYALTDSDYQHIQVQSYYITKYTPSRLELQSDNGGAMTLVRTNPSPRIEYFEKRLLGTWYDDYKDEIYQFSEVTFTRYPRTNQYLTAKKYVANWSIHDAKLTLEYLSPAKAIGQLETWDILNTAYAVLTLRLSNGRMVNLRRAIINQDDDP